MAEQKKQVMRFNDIELSLIKNTFAENDELLKTIRKVFLQMPLDAVDKSLIVSTFKGKKELLDLMSKVFNPKLDPNAPLHQLIDLWMSVDVKDKSLDEMLPIFEARELLIKLLIQQLDYLKNVSEGKDVVLETELSSLTQMEGKNVEEFYRDIIARNTLINHVEVQLSQMSILAGLKEETVEATQARLLKNSAK